MDITQTHAHLLKHFLFQKKIEQKEVSYSTYNVTIFFERIWR